ncbi:MAG: precorrin-6A/cobalt-precorrin-6A reductase, partial [SAR324 cluster bacterium]|nr:precorrin-6A/cobalt-precorrin-6A reductase [SAR324 cluster bacterium]
MRKNLLILGGTSEAYQLAENLDKQLPQENLNFISSLAGSTKKPNIPAGKFRTGGFGGLTGLKKFMVQKKISLLVDATHPFAENISKNALLASSELGLPILVLNRPP